MWGEKDAYGLVEPATPPADVPYLPAAALLTNAFAPRPRTILDATRQWCGRFSAHAGREHPEGAARERREWQGDAANGRRLRAPAPPGLLARAQHVQRHLRADPRSPWISGVDHCGHLHRRRAGGHQHLQAGPGGGQICARDAGRARGRHVRRRNRRQAHRRGPSALELLRRWVRPVPRGGGRRRADPTGLPPLSWNVFDFSIVAVGFLPFDGGSVVALRLLRLLRVMKLVRPPAASPEPSRPVRRPPPPLATRATPRFARCPSSASW